MLDRINRMHRMRRRVAELMEGSLNSAMGESQMASNKPAYCGHRELPIAPDGIPSGTPAAREASSDPDSLRSLHVLWFSKYPCDLCVPRSGTSAKKIRGSNHYSGKEITYELSQ